MALSVTGEQLIALYHNRKYATYVWMRGNKCMYVGYTRYGVWRLIGHETLQKDSILPSDEFQLFFHATKREAMAMEIKLIDKLKPVINKRANNGVIKSQTEQARWARRKVRNGECRICGKRRNRFSHLCDAHGIKQTIYMREYRKKLSAKNLH